MPVPQSETYLKQGSPPKTSSSLKLEVTRVSCLWPRKIFIQWVLRNPPAATGFTFNVYRSANPTGPWEKMTNDLVDTFFYLDDNFLAPQDRTTVGLVQMRMSRYYKVTARYLTEPEIEIIRVVDGSPDHRRAGVIRKLIRDAYVSLRKGNGTEVAVLKRMWYGEPCPLCRSSAGQTVRAHCSTCSGTGIVKGFWEPVYTYARRTVAPVEARAATQGIIETHRITAIMPYFPEVESGDLLIFLRDQKRYQIEQVRTTEVHAVTVHQECDISELARSAGEYLLSAQVDPWHEPKWY